MGDGADYYDDHDDCRIAAAQLRDALFGGRKPEPTHIWVDQRGNRHDVRRMNINHLKNALNMCRRKRHADSARVLEAELRRRNADG